jgi:hypothetical protein
MVFRKRQTVYEGTDWNGLKAQSPFERWDGDCALSRISLVTSVAAFGQ